MLINLCQMPVDHSLHTLSNAGFSSSACTRFGIMCLTGNSQWTWKLFILPIIKGVPQGSVFSPDLFIFYIINTVPFLTVMSAYICMWMIQYCIVLPILLNMSWTTCKILLTLSKLNLINSNLYWMHIKLNLYHSLVLEMMMIVIVYIFPQYKDALSRESQDINILVF